MPVQQAIHCLAQHSVKVSFPVGGGEDMGGGRLARVREDEVMGRDRNVGDWSYMYSRLHTVWHNTV